jgi:hypothetical protein
MSSPAADMGPKVPRTPTPPAPSLHRLAAALESWEIIRLDEGRAAGRKTAQGGRRMDTTGFVHVGGGWAGLRGCSRRSSCVSPLLVRAVRLVAGPSGWLLIVLSCGQVIIVGGGLAGLSAAHTVVERGGRALVLDKKVRHTHTRPFGDHLKRAGSGRHGTSRRRHRQ